jgi:hypothetical protein
MKPCNSPWALVILGASQTASAFAQERAVAKTIAPRPKDVSTPGAE